MVCGFNYIKNDFPDIQKCGVEVERAVLCLLDLPVVVVVLDIQDIRHLVAIRNIPLLFLVWHSEYVLQCSVLNFFLL